MQPFFLLSLLSSALGAPKRPRTRQIFSQVAPPRHDRWPSFLFSLGLHLLLILLLPAASEQLSDPYEREAWVRQEKLMRTLRIRIPEQLYIASSPVAPPAAKPIAAPAKLRKAARQLEAAIQGRRGRGPGRKRRFELPDLARRQSDQSIVQPNYSSDLLPSRDTQLPEMFFWAPPAGPADLAKAFTQPGHAKPPSQPRVLDLQPRLALPYSATTTLSLASLFPALFAPQESLPIRTSFPDQPSTHNGVSADPLAGDPTNVLSISSDPLPLRELLTVPPGNQIGRTSLAGDEAQKLAGSNGHGDRGNGSNGPSSDGQSARNSPGHKPADTAKPEPGSAVSETGSDVPFDPSPAGIAHSPAVQATKVTHPSGGVFDVVVQSSGVEGFPESAGYLGGSPIYSVYLAVGANREWVMQYCIPAGEEEHVDTDGPVVRLGNTGRLAAPYPRVTLRPPVRSRPGKHVMVYGFITTTGRFQDLRVLGTGDPGENATVIAVLEQWEFRPAMRQDQPLRVEILLAIPAE